MGWFRKIFGLVQNNPNFSRGPAEKNLLKFLINDIQRQIKALENLRKTLNKKEDKLRNKFDEANEDDKRKLAAYEDEIKNLDECLAIFRKKLRLTEAKFEKIILTTSRSPERAIKKDGDLQK